VDTLTALRLQIEWGADEALADTPCDRLGTVSPPAPAKPRRRTVAQIAEVAGSTGLGARAVEAAASAANLDALREAIAAFDGITLRDTATNLVFVAGNIESGLLFVADAPNADADRSGDAFAGQAGSYLEAMLRTIGIDRNGMMLVPLLPWRPPGDRPPSMTEILICLPFLHRLIALTAPRRVVLLGHLAARALLGETWARRRGSMAWHKADIPRAHISVDMLIMPSPAILLRVPQQRRDAWAALRLLRKTLNLGGTD
jgi:uracil-DNA glycosylase